MKGIVVLSLFILFSISLQSQDLTWTGNTDNDFFNEANWQYANGTSPTTNILRWNQAINLDLSIPSSTNPIIAEGIINIGNLGSLNVNNATIDGKALSFGTITLNDNAYIELSDANPLRENSKVNLNSGLSWVKIEQLKPSFVNSNHISRFIVNGSNAVYKTNLRLDNYYANGTIVRSNLSTITPVTFYDKPNLNGTSVHLTKDIVHSGSSITNLNNKIESFVLKRGYMLTLADNESGTGKSKNYIASEEDLTINKLPTHLLNRISFVRVLPWNWVTKKGIAVSGNSSLNEVGGTESTLGNTWFYRWSRDHESTLDAEYAPMSWGVGGADEDSDITAYRQLYKSTHIMSFNESDHCTGQSGQYRNLCQEDVAVGYHRNLMKTGLRIVSPSGRENAPFTWLRNFYDKATAQDIRIDVIGVHWYDWGSDPENNPNHSASVIFDRFKNYLQRVYDEYGLPIWITEFNANRYRNNATQLAFMQLAIPYLETLDYVERYAWFEPVHPTDDENQEGYADYYDDNNFSLTNVGSYFLNHNSSSAIPEQIVTARDNIGKNHQNNSTLNHNIVTNGNFKTNDTRAWLGFNNQVLTDDDDTSTNLDIFKDEPVANINNGSGSLYQVLEVRPNVTYTVSLDYKWKGDGGHNLSAEIRSGLSGSTIITSKTLTTNFDVWYTESIDFTAPSNVFKARLFFNKASGNRPLRITNVRVRLKPDAIWDGSENNDWNTAANWVGNTIPSNSDVVFIPKNLPNYPTVSSNLTFGQLFIESGASFITTGAITGGVTYFADLPDDKWYLLSPPVTGQTMNTNWVAAAGIATGQGSNIAIGAYQNGIPDNATGPWNYFTGTTSSFSNGIGYAMKKLSKGMFIFNGQIPSGNQNINITQGTVSNWNLIGNPFPSYIDISQFLTTNSGPLTDAFEAIYVWDAESNCYKALTSGYIHPGQAFFVNAAVANTNVAVETSMLSHRENVRFYKSQPTLKTELNLTISNHSQQKSTEIEFIEGKTKGLDPRFDIGLFDGVDEDLSIYTHLLEENNGIKFQKQVLPTTDVASSSIPLGIKANANEEIKFSIDVQHLPEELKVYLEDREKNTFTVLNSSEDSYTFTPTTHLDGVGRFYLHISSKALNTANFIDEKISAYPINSNKILVNGLYSENANIIVYDILGQVVLSNKFSSNGKSEIQLPKLSKGVYVVRISYTNREYVNKILIE